MSSRLTYRSPAADVLAGYARDHHVDRDAPIQAAAQTDVRATPARVWGVLTDVHGWADTLEPGVRKIQVPDGVRVGALFRRTSSGFRMSARFEVVEPERELAWTGYALGVHAVHRFELTPTEQGTRVICEESMGGRPTAVLYSSAKLQSAMEASLELFTEACQA